MSKNHHITRNNGFSLIEMIGVLAIMAILAGAIVPNALKSIDRAAVRSEKSNLENLADSLKLYLKTNGNIPTPANWATTLATLNDLNATDISQNDRGINRSFIRESNSTTPNRVLILSSMRTGLALPTESSINTARFNTIWDTTDGQIPATSSWAGWTSWNNIPTSKDYLLLQRINLSQIYQTDLATFTVSLNNLSSTIVSYTITSNGVTSAAINISATPPATATITGLAKGDRLNLYTAASGASLGYTYVVSESGKTFDFNGTGWIPQ